MNADKRRLKGRTVSFYLRSSAFIGGFVTLCLCASAQIKPNDFVAITGDSITEQRLYSVDIEEYLLVCRPDLKTRTMQFGWSGETSVGFLSRLDNDCLRFRPTIVTTCFGMNDGAYQSPDPARLQKYKDAMTGLADAIEKSGARLVLGSPGCVDTFTFRKDPAKAAEYNKTLAAERDIVRDIAKEHHETFADVYSAMTDTMQKAKEKYGEEYALAGGDGVHPASNGHLVMAYAFLKAMGCEGNIGTINVDFATSKASASEGHSIVSFDGKRLMIESTRLPFCFLADAKQSLAAPENVRSILPVLPFNEELNRFMLVMTGAPAGAKFKITWGDESKTFPSEQLSKGINLAGEFMSNPLVSIFKKVDEIIRAKQSFETIVVKHLVHETHTELPDETKLLDEITAAALQKDNALSKSASDLIVPTTHTITIEQVD